eukprot:746704-Hanusia_phi.AAC.3
MYICRSFYRFYPAHNAAGGKEEKKAKEAEGVYHEPEQGERSFYSLPTQNHLLFICIVFAASLLSRLLFLASSAMPSPRPWGHTQKQLARAQ